MPDLERGEEVVRLQLFCFDPQQTSLQDFKVVHQPAGPKQSTRSDLDRYSKCSLRSARPPSPQQHPNTLTTIWRKGGTASNSRASKVLSKPQADAELAPHWREAPLLLRQAGLQVATGSRSSLTSKGLSKLAAMVRRLGTQATLGG